MQKINMSGVMMIKLILTIWQLPQELIGFCMTRHPRVVTSYSKSGKTLRVYYTDNVFGAGVSLGKYIILDYTHYAVLGDSITIKHEYGHSIQSKILGPLYLPTVGIVSVTRNIWDRLFHKNWDPRRRLKWYYSAWPESWADKLGGVTRV